MHIFIMYIPFMSHGQHPQNQTIKKKLKKNTTLFLNGWIRLQAIPIRQTWCYRSPPFSSGGIGWCDWEQGVYRLLWL